MRRKLDFIGFGLALSVCGLWQAMAENAVSVDPTNSIDPQRMLNPMRAVDPATLKGFLELPLFDPARRQPPPALPVVALPPASLSLEPPPALKLLGVIHGAHDMAVARREGDGKAMILRAGDRVGGWAVTIVPPVGLKLRNGSRVFTYILFGKPSDVRRVATDPNGESGRPQTVSGDMAARDPDAQK